MRSSFFQFGERRPEYDVPVLNERAVRAAAGILFVPALLTFTQALQFGNFQPTRIFVIAFLADFSIRLFVNPLLAPTMILGQWIVNGQQPEWVGAPQKRFAWGIGFLLAIAMFFLMVIGHVVGPINMLVCGTCLLLLFFETSFGICIGCKIYNMLPGARAQLCPGGACEIPVNAPPAIDVRRGAVLAAFAMAMVAVIALLDRRPVRSIFYVAPKAGASAAEEAARCTPPAFARAIGHEETWKRHNNCL